jgi:hypothetical protein
LLSAAKVLPSILLLTTKSIALPALKCLVNIYRHGGPNAHYLLENGLMDVLVAILREPGRCMTPIVASNFAFALVGGSTAAARKFELATGGSTASAFLVLVPLLGWSLTAAPQGSLLAAELLMLLQAVRAREDLSAEGSSRTDAAMPMLQEYAQ